MSPVQSPRRTEVAPEPETAGRMDFRALAFAALGPLVAGYAVLAALLALVVATASGADFAATDVLLGAAPAWLAAAQVPVEIAGQPLGVLPLLLTALLLVLAERSAAGVADRLGPGTPIQALIPIGTIAGAHAVFGTILALLCGSGPVTAPPAAAFFVCGIFAGLAATVGVRRSYGIADAIRARTEPVVRAGVRTGVLALLALLAVGALTFLAALLGSFGSVSALFGAAAPDTGSGVGLFLLCLGYLPNVLIGSTSFLIGPGFDIGVVHAGPFSLSGGPVPAFPLLGALPEQAAPWWPVLLLVPLLVGGYVGWRCRVHADLADRGRAVGIAALTVACGCLVLAALAGGELGGGGYGPVRVPAGLLAVVAFCWIALPGIVVTTLGARPWRARPTINEYEAEPSEAEYDEPEDREPEYDRPEYDEPEDHESDDETEPAEDDFPADPGPPPRQRSTR